MFVFIIFNYNFGPKGLAFAATFFIFESTTFLRFHNIDVFITNVVIHFVVI